MHAEPKHAHRHFVALPLFAIFLGAIGAANGITSLQGLPAQVFASSVSGSHHTESEAERFTTPGAVSVMLEQGSDMTVSPKGSLISMERGSATLRADGYVQVKFGGTDLTVHAFATALHVLRGKDSDTVVALSGPFLAEMDGPVIVPSGHQLVLRGGTASILAVPRGWIDGKLSDIATVTAEAASQTAVSQMIIAGAYAQAADQLRAGSAGLAPDERADSAADVLPLLLQNPQPDNTQYVALLRSAIVLIAGDDTDVARLLALSAGLHPEYHSLGTVLADLFGSDSPAFWQLELIRTLHAGGTLPEQMVNGWRQTVEHASLKGVRTVLEPLMPLLGTLPDAIEQRGFPLHAALWKDSILHLLSFAESAVTADDADWFRQNVAPLKASLTLAQVPVDAASSSSSSVSSAPKVVLLQNPEGIARSLLIEHGAMLAVTSKFEPVPDSNFVRVTGVVVATPQGDIMHDFTLDVGTGILSQITRGGTVLPNSLSLEQFFGDRDKSAE